MGHGPVSGSRARGAAPGGGARPPPGPPPPPDEVAATLADWVGEFERVQWLLRLSPKLRALHAD